MIEFITGFVIGCGGALLLIGLFSTAKDEDNE